MNRFLLGQSYEQAGDLEKAKSIFEELFKTDQANVQYFYSLNKIYLSLKEYDASEQLLKERLRNFPYDITLYGMLGATYHLKGDEVSAFKTWDDALDRMGNNPQIFRTIANYAIERRAFNKAIDILKRGQQFGDDKKSLSYEIANLYSLTMQYKDAAEEYCRILSSNPDQLPSVESRIMQYVNKTDALTSTISVVEKYSDSHTNFEYLLARLYIEQKNFDRAFDLYSSIDKKLNSGGAELMSFALFLFNEKQFNAAQNVYTVLLERYPASSFISEIKLGLAKTKEAILYSTSDEDMETWKPYSIIKPNRTDEAGEVIKLYEQLTKLFPDSDVSYESELRIGWLYFFKYADRNNAGVYFKQIIEKSPYSQFSSSAYEGLGEISLLNGNLDKAIEYYSLINENSRTSFDRRNSAKYRLAQFYFFKNESEKSKKLLEEITRSLGDNTANDAIGFSLLLNTASYDSSNLLQFAEAEYLAAQQKYVQANEIYKNIASDQQAFILKNISGLRRAEMMIAVDDYTSAIPILQSISDEAEKNIYADKALYLMAKIFQFGLKDTFKAVESYEKLLAKFPSSVYLDEARAEIIKLKEKIS
ncbi:MAG: tetratricopeptide repeat protein [Ignavibacteriales bacterium]|nr:MAG: tetratricopeptide repeat protein [Ignavibacteriales bacterium]